MSGPVSHPAPLDLDAFGLAHDTPFLATVRVGDADLSRGVPHVSNVTMVSWLDRVAELHGDAVGQSRVALAKRGVMWFVARHEIDYLAELWRDDELVLATWVERLGRAGASRATAILRPSDGVVALRAVTRWVLVSLETRRPIRIPDDLRCAFAASLLSPVEGRPCTSA